MNDYDRAFIFESALSVLTLFVAATVLPVTAWCGDILRFNGQEASAIFSAPDPSDTTGCVFLDLNVTASQYRYQNPPGPGSSLMYAGVRVAKYDRCNNYTYQIDAEGGGPVSEQEFNITGNSASLKTTIVVTDSVSSGSFPITIDLTWTPTGPAQADNIHEHYHSAHYNLLYRYSGKYRPADVAGTASDGTTNFTPETSVWAHFGTGRLMQITEQ